MSVNLDVSGTISVTCQGHFNLNCLKYLLKFQLVLSIGNQCAASLQTFVKDGDYLQSALHIVLQNFTS